MSRLRAVLGLAAAGALALGTLAASLPAQVVRGTVVEQLHGSPIASQVVLISRAGGAVNHRAVTDSSGRFKLRPYPRGEYQLSVELARGHVDVGPPLGLTSQDTFTVVVEVPRRAEGPPVLRVVSHNRSRRLEEVGYYRRGTSGAGMYVGPGLLRARDWLITSNLLSHGRIRALAGLRAPSDGSSFRAFREFRPYDAFGVYAAGGWGGACSTLFVDGMRYGPAYPEVVDRVTPDEIEGIEIYPTHWSTPPEFATKGSSCGAILIWLKA
jgi:hypothetical protein